MWYAGLSFPISKKAPLEKFGYSVITANSAEKAVELYEHHDDIDLGLMDIDLGKGMDGTQDAGIILNHREIPILFLSSHTGPRVKPSETIGERVYDLGNK
jgi:CheY-like chemotaxis protein